MILKNNLFYELRQWLFEGTINWNSKDFSLQKSNHIKTPRGKYNKVPRDGGMSDTKYQKLLNYLPIDTPEDTKFAIIWVNKDKVNGITGVKLNNKFIIVAAIMKENINKRDKLFRDAKIRVDIGEFNFN